MFIMMVFQEAKFMQISAIENKISGLNSTFSALKALSNSLVLETLPTYSAMKRNALCACSEVLYCFIIQHFLGLRTFCGGVIPGTNYAVRQTANHLANLLIKAEEREDRMGKLDLLKNYFGDTVSSWLTKRKGL